MKTIQRIGIIFMLLVFLFGTTGLSVLHHICNSSKENIVTVYPEFFKSSGSSCCADESTGYACSNHVAKSEDALPRQIDASPCCKSIVTFFKLEILTERVTKLQVNTESAKNPEYPVLICSLPAFEQPLLKPAHFQFYSPPLFGKVLVYYLHQMKIPAHPSLA